MHLFLKLFIHVEICIDTSLKYQCHDKKHNVRVLQQRQPVASCIGRCHATPSETSSGCSSWVIFCCRKGCNYAGSLVTIWIDFIWFIQTQVFRVSEVCDRAKSDCLFSVDKVNICCRVDGTCKYMMRSAGQLSCSTIS